MMIGGIMILLRKDVEFTQEAQRKFRMESVEKLFELAELFFSLRLMCVFMVGACFPQYSYIMN